jgi:hypothetical protein
VEYIVEAGGPQMTISRTPNECWITKATHTHTHTHIRTHTQYVIAYLLLMHCNNGCTKGLSVIRILPSLLSFKRAQNTQLSTDVLKAWHNTTCQFFSCLCFPFVTACFIISLIQRLEISYTENLSLCMVVFQGYDAVF